jgi:uncharacterized protein (TIGR02145 family)
MRTTVIYILILIILSSSCQDENPNIINGFFFSDSLNINKTVTDIDGNVYKTIVIGDQTWMAENLRVTHYADGTPIAESFAPNNDNSLIEKYGRLYSFDVAMRGDSSMGSQGICPDGWHIPTPYEWDELVSVAKKYSGEEFAAALCIKGNIWSSGNNNSLFSAYPSGYNKDGESVNFDWYMYFWLSDLWRPNNLSVIYRLSPESYATGGNSSQYEAFNLTSTYNNLSGVRLSIRCIKNKDDLKLPTVVIDSVSTTTPKPVVYGRVKDNGKGNIKRVGICYGKNTNVNLKDTTVLSVNISSNSTFSCELKAPEKNTTYYVRAFAKNELGAGFSKESTLKTTIITPQISAITLTKIASTTATFTATVTDDGGNAVTARGVCWSTLVNPSIIGSKTNNGPGSGLFESNITGLIANTSYYIRAYATNGKGTGYSDQFVFMTLPTVNVGSTTNLTYKSATISGVIPTQGNNPITEYGICWGTAPIPTIADNKTTSINLIGGNFSSSLTDLMAKTKYYVRAYITNASGTSYSSEASFTTLAPAPPTLTIGAINNITTKSATVAGGISAQGDLPIIDYGHCWSNTTNPTISNNKMISTNLNAGLFSSSLSDLIQNTKYYIKAYATTSYGTSYSNEATFTTIVDPHTISDGLLAFYNFDGKNCNDALGKYNGVINGGVTFNSTSPNLSGYAASFDGSSGYINVPYKILPSTGSWSISLWVKTNKPSIGLFRFSNGLYNYVIIDSQYKLKIDPNIGNACNYSVNLSSSLLNNNWHNLSITYNTIVVKYYVDGNLIESIGHQNFAWNTMEFSRIGATANSAGIYYSGSMDNIRFYNKALSTSEILTLYNAKQ